MSIELARQIAAGAWCTPETSSIKMDARLAKAFADILNEENIRIKMGYTGEQTGNMLEMAIEHTRNESAQRISELEKDNERLFSENQCLKEKHNKLVEAAQTIANIFLKK